MLPSQSRPLAGGWPLGLRTVEASSVGSDGPIGENPRTRRSNRAGSMAEQPQGSRPQAVATRGVNE